MGSTASAASSQAAANANPGASGYRPPQWSSGPAMVSITVVPVQGSTNSLSPAALPVNASNYVPGTEVPATGPLSGTLGGGPGAVSGSGSTPTTYVFDAVLELEHEQRWEKTRHPVQTGADLSSHAYLMPPRVVMYIGMSDAMAAYASGANNASTTSATPDTATPFSGSSTSKSVNAYQTMITLQAARSPLTVTTRLRTYTNMLITSISPREDFKTITGLKMRIEFEQIFTATTVAATTGGSVSSLGAVSARPDATQQTGLGQVNSGALSAVTAGQFAAPAGASLAKQPAISMAGGVVPVVNGAGLLSSIPGQLTLPGYMGPP